MFDASYTFSREMDDTDTVEDNQGFNAGGNARGGYDILDPELNMHIGFSDLRTASSATSSTSCRSGPIVRSRSATPCCARSRATGN